MAAKQRQFSWDHPVIIFLVMMAIVTAMSQAAEVLKPLALAILLCFVLSPVVGFLERRRFPRAPAVLLTVLLALGGLGGVAYVVYGQLDQMADDLPKYEKTIAAKLDKFNTGGSSKLTQLENVGKDLNQKLANNQRLADRERRDGSEKVDGNQKLATDADSGEPTKVQVVSKPSIREQIGETVGPVLEVVGSGAFILILVLFMLMNREDLADRIVQLFGRRRVTLTTRTMDEVGQRISRYLGIFATVNSTFGLIVGLGLWAIGVKYAALWGFLAAALRFIPYIGPGTAFALPLIFSFATADGWAEPLKVAALFGVMEVMANSFLEPIIYGKTTGVSALGLLVAAMFWTWLWGPLGLLLSTPMTVCLAVVGKYVPSLGFFAILLGEEAELPQDVRYYQRLLALDQDGASEIVEEALKTHPRAEVYDTILIPALSKAEKDFAREELDDREHAFAWRVSSDIVTELDGTPDVTLTTAPLSPAATTGEETTQPYKVVGIPANDASDALVLRMLSQLLAPTGTTFLVLSDTAGPLALLDSIEEAEPDLIVLSHLPPVGLTPARYLARRLRARFPKTPILIGRWGDPGDPAALADRLSESGANKVAFNLPDARDLILAMIKPKTASPASPSLAASLP